MGSEMCIRDSIGPLAGGFIVDTTSWRWVFLINLPVGLIALAIISSALRLTTVRRQSRIDIVGAMLLVIGVGLLLLSLVWGGTAYTWQSPVIVSLIASGTFVTAAFLWWETRVPEPLLPLRLFQNGIYSVASVLGFLIGVALFGGVVFLPLFLQVVNGVSATDSGLLVLPLTAGIVVGSVGAGRLTTSTGRYRRYPIIGSALAVVGMYFLSGMTAETARVLSSSYMLVLGLGVGMVLQLSLIHI